MEYIRRNQECIAGITAVVGAFVLFVDGVVVVKNLRDPGRAYMANFTGDGDCLDGTPYDPDNGASLYTGEIDGTEVFAVFPQKGSVHTPPPLHFVVDHAGVLQPDLEFADYGSASILIDAECPDQPSGY